MNAIEPTPHQTLGPFYPGEQNFSEIEDLTSSRLGKCALGEQILIRGRVQDVLGHAIPSAVVEIWQAGASGRYGHPDDPNPAVLDPGFQYSARALSRGDGSFMFRTVVPGCYPAEDNWLRPPHIHFRVRAMGFEELITQMYFKGHPLNSSDRILQETPQGGVALVVEFVDSIGYFVLTLRSVLR